MKIAFNTANLVARATGYQFELKHWSQQHSLTVKHTDEREWTAICAEIQAAGFKAVEIWQAHIDPSVTTQDRAKTFKKILSDHGLTPIGMGGGMNHKTAELCQWIGIPAITGHLGHTNMPAVRQVIKDTGIHFNFENHPEKSAEEILQKIDGGGEGIGLAIDTGWLGTQGLNAAETMQTLGKMIKHVHVKDVLAAGAHETCPLGAGIVDLPAVIKTLKKIGYSGWYSWEDEPENRNPMLIAAESRRWIEQHIS